MARVPLATRARAAVDAFRYGGPSNWWRRNMQHKAGEQRTDLPFLWPDWVEGEPQWHMVDFATYCEDGFQANAIIYSALMYKYRAITAAPLRAYTGTREEPERLPEDHPIQQLCRRPNQYQSGAAFSGLNLIYLNLAGNSYVVPLPFGAKGRDIEALIPLRPDRVHVIPQDGKSIGFMYFPVPGDRSKAVPFLLEDMLHVKLPNPMDPLEGMGEGLSPVAAMASSGDVDNEITRHLKRFFQRGGMPPGLLSFDSPMTPKQMAAARERWEEIYGGVDNWAKVAILDSKGKYQRLGLSFEEMGFDAIDSRNEPRMAAVFGVPLILLETRTALISSTYHNKQEARRMFWDDTFIAELAWYESEWNDAFKDSDIWLAHDLTGVPALQPDPKDTRAAWAEAFAYGAVTRNEYRAIVGADPADDGDVYLLPFSVQVVPYGKTEELDATDKEPVPEAFGGPPQGGENEEEEEEGNEDEGNPLQEEDEEGKIGDIKAAPPVILTGRNHWPAEVKAQYWHLMDSTATSYEAKMMAAVGRALKANGRATLDILSAHSSVEDGVDWTGVGTDVQGYYAGPEAEAVKIWHAETMPILRHLAVARAMHDAELFGVAAAPVKALKEGFDSEAFLAGWFDSYSIKYADAITDSSRAMIKSMLTTGAMEQVGSEEMAKRLKEVFLKWANDAGHPDTAWASGRLAFYRREMIARTEIIGASNRAGFETLRYYGIGRKEWLTAIDGRERPTHAAANGQVRLTDEAFEVGGELLQYPGDKNASPGNVINCRCTTLPVTRM